MESWVSFSGKEAWIKCSTINQAKYSTITGQRLIDRTFCWNKLKADFGSKHDKDFNKSSKSGSFSTVLYFYNKGVQTYSN